MATATATAPEAQARQQHRATFTERERTFIRTWKRLFGSTPADWSIPQVLEGISSFLDWRELLNREATSLDVLEDCLRLLKRQTGYPSFGDVVREYNRKTNRAQGGAGRAAGGVLPKCSACHDTGVVLFATLLRQGRVFCLDPRLPRPVLRGGEYIGTGTAPCVCAAGDRQQAHWGLDHGARQRCYRNRMTQSEHDAFAMGPLGTAERGAITAAMATFTPRQAASMLVADDARREANADEWDSEEGRW